jgi:hypothetical protein
MDAARKKELALEYKHRRPEMGVISFRCAVTGDAFFYPTRNMKSDINRNRFQLELGNHPNRELQALWEKHGSSNFNIAVAETLPYDEKEADRDYAADLEKLCERHINRTEKASRLKR